MQKTGKVECDLVVSAIGTRHGIDLPIDEFALAVCPPFQLKILVSGVS
jgi:hypothetical protein